MVAKPLSGATPLLALDAVAVDTETTGLDTRTARIVQIGARRLVRGTVTQDEGLDLLVNPGIPIPVLSSRIHGIHDRTVATAPPFADAWQRLSDWVNGCVVVGHSIGYDLAVFERECGRAGIAFTRPRSLCVRLLAAIANPMLPDYSLETIASWLGVSIQGRHSALGDASAAADLLVALVPKLAERGIRTLAEAERASLSMSGEIGRQHEAGWADPVLRPSTPAYGAVDPYAYRHRVGEVMSAPPVVVAATTPAADAIALMVERRISALFVSTDGCADRAVGEFGIVTERDMMRRLATGGASALQLPVGSFATRPLVSVRAEAFVYRAIGRMERLRIRHLAVRGARGELAGIVSARDLLKLRASAAVRLDDAIEAAASAVDLAAAWATLPAMAAALVAEETEARVVCEIVSEELCSATRRAAMLAEAEMVREGNGQPPCSYALLVLGSGGRGESLLAADQDNAIVFADSDAGGDVDRWFSLLGEKLARTLDTSGIPFCKGGVMAMNPAFRGSLKLWQTRITDWVARSRPEDLLNVDILFDMRHSYGDGRLADELFKFAYEQGSANPGFSKLLGERIGASGSPFTMLGGLQVEDGRIDLKLHGLFPIVAAARSLAIRHGIAERATKARLERLMSLEIGGDDDLKAMLHGHSTLMRLLLTQQAADFASGIPVTNRVEAGKLDRADYQSLKMLLKQLRTVPTLVRDLMFG